MYPAQFEYHSAESVSEATEMLADNPDAEVIAGGHSLLPTMKSGLASPDLLVDISRIDSMQGIDHADGSVEHGSTGSRTESGDTVSIGGLTTYATIADSDVVQENVTVFAKAAHAVGDVQVRNRGTLCGAVATAAPAGDPPVLAALFNADIVATSIDGDTIYDGSSFYDDGATALEETELIREVRFPALGPDEGAAYEKWKPAGCAWPVGTVGAYLSMAGGTVEEARLYTGALEGEPTEMAGAAGLVVGEKPDEETIRAAATRLGEDAEPLSDADGTAEFKSELSKKLTKDALETAASRAGA